MVPGTTPESVFLPLDSRQDRTVYQIAEAAGEEAVFQKKHRPTAKKAGIKNRVTAARFFCGPLPE